MPKGLQKIHFIYDATGLTRFGGISLFQQFCKSLALRRFLQTHVQWPICSYKKYHPVDLFLVHLFAVVAGIGRVENTQSLIHNGLLPTLLGLPNFPHRDTLRDFFWKFIPHTFKSLQVAHNKLRQNIFQRLGPVYDSIVDVDTSVLTVYGYQEGSEIGYNPHHRGKKSFCPIISSEGRLGLTLDFELRPGNVYPSTNIEIFMEESLNKLPKTVANTRTRIRADVSFYNKDFINFLDGNHLEYVIVAKITNPIKNILSGVSYHSFQKNWEAGEFYYKPHFWKMEHRFISIRRLLEVTEFPQTLFTIKDYSYRVVVTNLTLTPQAVWRFYCKRALQELLIRELKTNYALAKIPTRSFLANQVYLEIVLWAYDLVIAFKQLCIPQKCKNWTIPTLRRNLWWLPAELVHPDHYNRLRLPKLFPYQDIFQYIQRAVTKVKPLI